LVFKDLALEDIFDSDKQLGITESNYNIYERENFSIFFYLKSIL